MATPTPERSDGPGGAVNAAARRSARPWPEPSSTALIARMAATLIPVLQFWTLALWRGPRPFPAPATAILRAAAGGLVAGLSGPTPRQGFAQPNAGGAPSPEGNTTKNNPPTRNRAHAPT